MEDDFHEKLLDFVREERKAMYLGYKWNNVHFVLLSRNGDKQLMIRYTAGGDLKNTVLDREKFLAEQSWLHFSK